MGITTAVAVKCDVCGRIPGPPSAETIELCRGTYLYPIDDTDQYGWLMLTPSHMCLEPLGHNRIPSERIVLCPSCWPKVLEPIVCHRISQ